MNRVASIAGLAASVVGAAGVVGWFAWRSDVTRLMEAESITKETGLILPSSARITAARAHVFSIADGENYEWLLQSETSLMPWVTANMSAESGGWEHVRTLDELGFFGDEAASNAAFGGVWRSVAQRSGGREETSYLYLAQDGKVGILSTFRP